jgi:hypothetical protein
MGLIHIDEIIKEIDDITEEGIKEKYVLEYEEAINDFDSFIIYLNKHSLFIEYMCYCDFSKAKKLFIKIMNAFQIENVDVDEKVDYIRINCTRKNTRIGEWQFSTIPLINSSGDEQNLICCSAEYKYGNKFDKKFVFLENAIIYDKNKKIIWINNDYRHPKYYLYYRNNFYGISYDHKDLTIYKNINIIKENIVVNPEHENLDDILNEFKYEKIKCEEISMDLSDYLPMGFFHRGPKYTKEYKILYPDGINYIREIKIINGLVKIEIENITYPHKGYVLLELEHNKVIEAKKYGV